MTTNFPRRAGCHVTDDPGTCPQGLDISEHRLVEGAWIHPVGMDVNGRWIYDEDPTDERTEG